MTDPTTVTKARRAKDVVTREVDGDEQEMLRVPISSTRADREGDRFDKDALDGIADQIRAEQPMVFDNHGLAGGFMDAIPYDSRETVGAQMDAELESAEDGEWDLFALVNPDGTHPEGERMLKQVREEAQPLKFSVGFKVKGYDEREEVEGDYEGDGRVFTAADLMETSRVGIPANPDASVTQSFAAKDGLPGVTNHPMMQMLAAMQGEQDADGMVTRDAVDSDTVEDATPVHVDGQGKAATDGGDPESKGKCDDDGDCPDGEVCVDGECVDESEAQADISVAELRDLKAELAELREDDGDECSVDTDCPEGEVCLEGECVPEDEVDDSGDVPEYVKDLREQNRELREEVDEVRSLLAEGRGDAETGDTTMTGDTPDPDETDESDDDDDHDHSEDGRGLLGL